MRTAIVAAIALLHLAAQQPARDAAPRLTPGTAVIAGVVRSDDAEARPLRGAIVTINHVDRLYGDTAITDAQGRFEVPRLPAGRYLLSIEKDGFVRTRYGASRPGRAGTPIAIADRQRLDTIVIRMVRGAVLTGRIVGTDGEPAEGTPVALSQFVSKGGERQLVPVYSQGEGRTDDLGVFRIWGLPAGEYVVCAELGGGFEFDSRGGGVQQTTAADVSWARLQLQSASTGDRRADSAPPSRPQYGFANVYYPGVLQSSAATVVTLAAGEERGGLDFALQLTPTWKVHGTVVGRDGNPPAQPPTVYLVDVGPDAPGFNIRQKDGARFEFGGVAPGTYALAAVMDEAKEWATADVAIGGQDLSVTLTLQPGLTASGTIAFRGTTPAPDFTRVQVRLEAAGTKGGFAVEPVAVAASADGTFTMKGLIPGAYRLRASLQGASRDGGAGWTMRSAVAGTRDIADLPLDIRPGMSTAGIAVTFTDRPTELSGTLQDASGRPASDYFIIVFPSDDRMWFEGSRRLVQTRPGNDGRFVVSGLPPGDYLLAALTDVERDEWHNQAFLRQLVPAALRVSLDDGEKKVQNVRIQ